MIFGILSFSLPMDVLIGRFQLAIGFGETRRSVLTSVMKFSFGRLVFWRKCAQRFLHESATPLVKPLQVCGF